MTEPTPPVDSTPPSPPASEPISTPTPAANSAPQPQSPAPAAASGKNSAPRNWIVPLLLALLIGLMAAQWLYARYETRDLRGEIARQLQAGSVANTETKVITKSTQEAVKELQAKVSVLENKQVEALSQQLALEQLYQDLSKNRDEWALSEIEQVLSTASQQLQLAGNVPGALIALHNADKSLSRSDKPQFIKIRRAIANDIDKLKAFPVIDVTGIALRLDSVIGQIDSMPLLSDEKPVITPMPPKEQRPAPTKDLQAIPETMADRTSADWLLLAKDKWGSLVDDVWYEIKQLIRVRSVNTPDALLLSPTQAYYARENLKLRLLNARLALLSRNESAFRSDMIAAQDTISKYFDTRAKQTQTAQTLLKQVQGSNLALEAPTLTESLNAVRTYKAKP